MLELFRFIEQAFPAPRVSDNVIKVSSDQTGFQRALLDAAGSDHPRDAMANLADRHLAGDAALHRPDELRFGKDYANLSVKIADALKRKIDMASLSDLVREVFDRSAPDLVGDEAFTSDRHRLDDTLLALKLARHRGPRDAASFATTRRLIALIERAPHEPGALSFAELSEYMRRPLAIDARFLPPPPAAAPSTDHATGDDPRRVHEMLERVAALHETWQTLMALQPEEIELKPARERDEAPAPDRPRDAASAPFAHNALKTSLHSAQPEFIARPQVVDRFSPVVRSTLADLEVRPDVTSLPRAVEKVKAGLIKASNEVRTYLTPSPVRVYRVGADFFALQPVTPLNVPALPAASAAPAAMAVIKPLMVGNLQVVKQELVGYEAAEVSHIENVLKGETFKRETERQELTETITTLEKENFKTEERDLQTTERHELRTEAQKTASQQTITGSGQSSSIAYGSLVENNQSQYGKEVTDRAVNSVSERVRQVRTEREQKIFTEKTLHEFTNANGDNIRGIYQWVDKRFKTRVLNYGKRLLFDVVVPEPAGFFIDSLKYSQQGENFHLIKPEPPGTLRLMAGSGLLAGIRLFSDLQPEDLHVGNYLQFATKYSATGSIEPPPADFQTTVSWPASGQGSLAHRAEKIVIPPGYTAVVGFYQGPNWRDENGNVANGSAEITIGSGYHFDLTKFFSETFKMAGEVGELPITLAAGGMKGYAVAVGIVCRNDTAYKKWQIKTYTAIMDGYRKQLEEYEQRLAAMQTMVRTQMLLTKNYAHDPSIERTELKKAFTHLLMSEYYSKVNIATPDPTALPKDVALTTKWGSVVAFFERALEWENMMYFYYPYFWARRSRWAELILIQDLSPEFEAFLKAGAARVVVPVRPGFEGALAHYQETGEIWFGKDMLEMFSEMNVSIIDEIMSRNVTFGHEKCVQEWEVKLPTTLVMLKADSTLPAWSSVMDCSPDNV